ncbi:MAG: LamG-like jellyroll fold domain-containing protein, partial [Planctomycetota bacterium]
MNTDQWYHVAATNDGSTLKLYVDGRLKDSASSTGLTGVNHNAYIGGEPNTTLYYTGLIDDVRIYDRAVSESEFLDMADPIGRWNRKDSWRASVYRNGSPGWDDSGILPNPGAVVINEVMSHSNAGPDWIELHNTTSKPIDIGGWFLSDNDRDEPNLMKYRIPDGTMIDPNSYLVFYGDTNFNKSVDPCCLIPFALSENGEEACLSSPLDPNGMLTGYREVEDFGASQTNV